MINKSLLTLQKVIKSLSDCGGDRAKAAHIPFRESKLTRILDNSLGGDAKTLIICTVTPVDLHRAETLSVLQFARMAKMIKNKPRINEKLSDKRLLQQYLKEIEALKGQVSQLEDKAKSAPQPSEKENVTPTVNLADTSEKWESKLSNMDNMIELYSKRYLSEKERADKKRPWRMTWVNAQTIFDLRDRGVELYDEEQREWQGPKVVKGEIPVHRQGGRISCPSRFAERDAYPDSQSKTRSGKLELQQRSRESLKRMVEEQQQEMAYCQEAKMRADEEVQKMLQERLEWLDVIEQHKSAMQEAVHSAFQASKQERMEFVNKLKASIW